MISKRYLLFLPGLFSLFVSALAAEPQSIVLAKHDGTEIALLLSDSPKITFSRDEATYSGDHMVLTTANARYELEVAELSGLKISESTPTAIEEITSPDGATTIEAEGDAVVITTDKPAQFSIFTLLGTTIHSASIPSGVTHYPLGNLTPGIYIFRVDNKSVKIQIR